LLYLLFLSIPSELCLNSPPMEIESLMILLTKYLKIMNSKHPLQRQLIKIHSNEQKACWW